MKAIRPFLIIALVMISGCAAVQATTVVPPSEFPAEGPRIASGGLFEMNGAVEGSPVLRENDGNFHLNPGNWYRFKASVSLKPSKIVKVFNKVDIWQEFASGPTLNGSKTFEYDLSGINDCCDRVWAPWTNSFAYNQGWYATFTMWVVDENGRTSNSITIGPIVVKGQRGGPVVPPKVW